MISEYKLKVISERLNAKRDEFKNICSSNQIQSLEHLKLIVGRIEGIEIALDIAIKTIKEINQGELPNEYGNSANS